MDGLHLASVVLHQGGIALSNSEGHHLLGTTCWAPASRHLYGTSLSTQLQPPSRHAQHSVNLAGWAMPGAVQCCEGHLGCPARARRAHGGRLRPGWRGLWRGCEGGVVREGR